MENLELTEGQQLVFDSIKKFLDDKSEEIFIIKGYAGTGKTTLITFLGNYLQSVGRDFDVLAPTGRAAKVLRSKFSEAVLRYGYSQELAEKGKTIHSVIYSSVLECKEVDNPDFAEKTYKYYFPLFENASPGNNYKVMIVDESSMIGDNAIVQEFVQYGSGKLLSDMLEYKRLCKIGKIIFVGDDAQLPPVGDPESRALQENYFIEKGLGVMTDKLTEVLRQKEESVILQNAFSLRSVLEQPVNSRNTVNFVIDKDVELSTNECIAKQYLDINGIPEIGGNLIVCYSNRQCFVYNQAIREILYEGAETVNLYGENIIRVQPGDILLNTMNNRGRWGVDIYNGDMLKVVDVGETEIHNTPVRFKGDDKATFVELSFTKVNLLCQGGELFECMLLDNSLYNSTRDVNVFEIRALYVDFCSRIRKDYPQVKEGSNEFKDLLSKDIYFNALHVKFGYAITVHKSQGGEWDTVMVDYSGRIGTSNDALRWCYTATTRAKKKLVAINPPIITPFDGLEFTAVGKVAKSPKNFYSEDLRVILPNTENSPIGVAIKIKGIMDAIEDTDYKLLNYSVMGYQIKFQFLCKGEHINIDCYFDGEGVVKRMNVANDGSDRDNLCKIINDSLYIGKTVTYSTENKVLSALYERIRSACIDENVIITNIIDFPSNYYILYCLKTDATFACIQFYYNVKSALGTAMPKSELGNNDEKLNNVISNLKS